MLVNPFIGFYSDDSETWWDIIMGKSLFKLSKMDDVILNLTL